MAAETDLTMLSGIFSGRPNAFVATIVLALYKYKTTIMYKQIKKLSFSVKTFPKLSITT